MRQPRNLKAGLLGLGVFAGGVALGIAAEELLYRRLARRRDPEGEERIGTIVGKPAWVESFDGTRLYAEVHGPEDLPACLFLHGFTLSHQVWHYQLHELGAEGRWRLIAFDARGHGRSGPVGGPGGDTPFDATTLARDLHRVLQELAPRPAVIVGHSMGGITIQGLMEYARRYPEEMGSDVRGIVLVNTTFTGALGTWFKGAPHFVRTTRGMRKVGELLLADPKRLQRLRIPNSDLALLATRLGFGVGASPAHVALTRRIIAATPTDTVAAGVVGVTAFEGHEGLESIDVPVLVVAGDRDLITPVWLSREIAARIPDSELVLFKGAGHMAMLERHEEFSRVLSKFLDRVLPSHP